VTEIPLDNVAQTEQVFEEGLSHRMVRKTKMNEASSRSHLVFSIIIDATNTSTKVRTKGKLSFVDLAGSERTSKTGTDKQGQAEANAINLSLSSLGNVIHELSSGAKFVSYRSHVLTKLMKDSLGGTAKTLMFVNASPSIYNEMETKNALDYAQRVKMIKNTVGKNIETKETKLLKDHIDAVEDRLISFGELLQSSDKVAEYEELKAKHKAEDNK